MRTDEDPNDLDVAFAGVEVLLRWTDWDAPDGQVLLAARRELLGVLSDRANREYAGELGVSPNYTNWSMRIKAGGATGDSLAWQSRALIKVSAARRVDVEDAGIELCNASPGLSTVEAVEQAVEKFLAGTLDAPS